MQRRVFLVILPKCKKNDLRLTLGGPLLQKSCSPMCIAIWMLRCYWSELRNSHLLFIGHHKRYLHIMETERRGWVKTICAICEQQEPWTEPQLHLLRSISLKTETQETPRRRISVTSSLNEISTEQLGKRVVWVGGKRYYAPDPSSGGFRINIVYKDDVNDLSSPTDICTWHSLSKASNAN